MKKQLLFVFGLVIVIACKNDSESSEALNLPYKAGYSSSWNNDVSDKDLLTVLNSYKAWETGDLKALRATFADSIGFRSWNGYVFDGLSDSLISIWGKSRDSMASVVIKMDTWMKNHSIDKKADFISVWYKEIDTYKDGKVDSLYLQDDNLVENGKIVWYTQHKQVLK